MMMKRKILAAVIPALLVAGAANAAEIYNKEGNKVNLTGKVVGLHYFARHNGDHSPNGNGDKTYARLGFDGETQIDSQLTGYGRWEYNFQGNNAESSQEGDKTRLAFAGLKFDSFGSLDYGRNNGLVYDAIAITDVLPEFGGDRGVSDNFFSSRVGGVATYRNHDFFGQVEGLDFALQYLGKNERNDIWTSNGDGWATSASYTANGFSIIGAYGAADRTNSQQAQRLGRGNKAEQWATGVKYDANNIYVAALYGETHNATRLSVNGLKGFANKTQDFSVVAQYKFDFGLQPSIAYYKSKAKHIGYRRLSSEDFVNYIDIGATYSFNNKMATYIDYNINQISKKNKLGVGYDDTVALGIVYQF